MRKYLPILLFCCTSVQAGVSEHVFDNGLKLLVLEDHRAPTVVSQIWYKVGSSYENVGQTGISHMVEHMMFKGTEKFKEGVFSKTIADVGGTQNASTGLDFTFYYQILDKSRLETAFQLEADRMTNLCLNPASLKTELQVVTEERRVRTEDNGYAKLIEQFKATAFANSPYKNPVIGWPSDIANYTADDVGIWYHQWYAPNNATLVVVGDVDTDEVIKLAEQYFGDIDAQSIPKLKPTVEIEQLGTKRINVRLNVQLPYVVLGFKTPTLKSADKEWEVYALEALAYLLGVGNGAQLPSHLIRGKQIATSVGASYSMRDRLPSLFLVEGTPLDGYSVRELERAMLEEIQLLRTTLIDAETLNRVKIQVYAHDAYSRDNYYNAVELGRLETEGIGWRKGAEYIPNMNKVTAQQIQAVAQKYFVDDNLTVGNLEPQRREYVSTSP